MDESLDDKIRRVKKELQDMAAESEYESREDYVYSESEEQGWRTNEPNFTKRIATPIPTKQRRRVTLLLVTSH